MLNRLFRRSNPTERSASLGLDEARQFTSQVTAERPRRRTRARLQVNKPGEVVRLIEGLPPPRPTTAKHAEAFLRHLQRRPELQGHWVPAIDVQAAYFDFCTEIGWRPRSWAGRYGVAAALGRITAHRHKRIEIGDETRDLRLYLVPTMSTADPPAPCLALNSPVFGSTAF
jgi:hypothetical protein